MTENEHKNSDRPSIDRNAPAGSDHSLGAESVRDGRPATDDDVVEAIDEVGPAVPSVEPAKKIDK